MISSFWNQAFSANNKKLMTDMLRGHTNFSLHFFNVKALLKGYRLKPSEHISIETYYRFLIQDLLTASG